MLKGVYIGACYRDPSSGCRDQYVESALHARHEARKLMMDEASQARPSRRNGCPATSRGALPLLLLVALVGCGPRPIPTGPSVREPEAVPGAPDPRYLEEESIAGPGATPSPSALADTAGWLFLDSNGSGVREAHESPVVGQRVCARVQGQEDLCTNTDATGRYAFEGLAPTNTRVSLHLGSAVPGGDTATTGIDRYRYWLDTSGLATAGGYSVVGYVTGNLITVPTHTVADSAIHSLEESIEALAGEKPFETGLVQGLVTLPFLEDDYDKISHVFGYDHDPAPRSVLGYSGARSICQTRGGCTPLSPWRLPFFDIPDGQQGLEYRFTPDKGMVGVVAAHEGQARVEWTEGSDASIVIINTGSGTGILTRYSGLQEALIRSKWYVRRGQLIGYVAPHDDHSDAEGDESSYGLRFELFGGRAFGEGVGTSKDFFAMENRSHIVPGFNDASMWTLWNRPQFPFTLTEIDGVPEPAEPGDAATQ